MGSSRDDERGNGLRVLGLITEENGGVDAYRIILPFMYLNNQGFRCSWMSVGEAADRLMANDTRSVFDHDVIVVSRRLSREEDVEYAARMMCSLSVMGAKIVYETDDDYTGQYRELNGTCLPYLPHVDAITVSTAHLGKMMGDLANKPVYVLPNSIHREWFAETAMTAAVTGQDTLSVMLAGTKSHYEDWKVMRDVIPVLRGRFGIRFLVGGVTPDYLRGLVTPLPPVPYTEYPKMLAQADILCAPLNREDRFNLSKSPIKAIEGWSAVRPVGKKPGGCAMVVESHPVYRGTVNNRNNGILVREHNPEAWLDALSLVIQDKALRQKIQVNGWKSARQYDISQHWGHWARAYNSMFQGGRT